MAQYIDKSALVAELKKRFDYRVNGLKAINNGTFWDKDQSEDKFNAVLTRCAYNAAKNEVFELMCFLDTLEVIDLYEHLIQYPSRESAIKAHAEDYSWNIESELFNQLSSEQQKLWRKEIEQACISGGYSGLNLARDPRYKENLEVKEVDLDRETTHYLLYEHCSPLNEIMHKADLKAEMQYHKDIEKAFKAGFKLGMQVSNKAQKGE